MTTPNLMLPEVPQAIRNASEPLNRGLLTVDALLQSAVVSHTQTVPPINPVQGQRWIIPQDAIGAWQNRTNHIAYRGPEGWIFLVPRPGWLVWSLEDETFYVYKSSGWKPLSGGGGGGGTDPQEVYEHFSDMDFGPPSTNPFYSVSVSGGSVAPIAGEMGHPGIMRLTKNGAGIQANLFWQQTPLQIGDGETDVATQIRLSVADPGGNTSLPGPSIRVGLMVGTDSGATELVGFRYLPTANSGRWFGSTINGGTETAVNSSFAHSANTWFELRFVISDDATSVEFFINGVSIGTSTTNIPTGIPLRIRFSAWFTNDFGDGAYSMDVDWVRVRKVLTVPRI